MLGVLAVACVAIGGDCSKMNADGGLEGGGPSLSCYIADMFLCNEYPAATAAQQTDAPVACSSASGTFLSPAACPMAGYQGKCTRPPASTGMDGVQIQRFYTGADVAYAQ